MQREIAERQILPMGLLAAAGFLSSAGARIVDPLLAVIANDFRVSIPEVSVLVAAFTLPYGLNQLLLGPLGDRFGKLRVMLAALAGYAIATLGCALAGDLSSLTVMRAVAGASSAGLIPVSLAYIGDAVPYAERQATVGRFLNGVVLAQMIAGPVGGLFSDYLGWRAVFLLLSVSALVVAVTLAVRLPALPDRRQPTTRFDLRRYAPLVVNPRMRLLLMLTLAEGAVMAGSFPFLAPYLHDAFGLDYGTVGLVLACFGLGAFGYTRFAGRWIAAFGEIGLVLLGGAVMTGALALGMLVHRWQVFVLVEAMLGFGYFTLHSVLQARSTEMLPQTRATSVAAFIFMLFMGQALGALATGANIGLLGYAGAFWAQAAGIVLVALWLAALLRHSTGGDSRAR